jgi:mRNA interferase HigB
MHIITHSRILQAQAAHPDSTTALEQWYRQTKRAAWRNFAEVKAMFPAVDKVGDKYVFDVGGNKLRLIAAIHFNAGKVFIRAVLTHKDYDKGAWK